VTLRESPFFLKMSVLEKLFAIGPVRRLLWGLWYPFLTGRLRKERVFFLNYAFQADPPEDLELRSEELPDRAWIQLYQHVAGQVDLSGSRVLEVSCGHGGGAAWISQRMGPLHYTGLDLNATGITFCREHHRYPNLDFVRGDALQLPFADGSMDAVVNVEASHCYPDLAAFLREVARVLRPGGHFLYADFRFLEDVAAWDAALEAAPLRMMEQRDISMEVLRGMDVNAKRSAGLVERCLPRLLRGLGRDFAAVPGSRVYEALRCGQLIYRSAWFEKRE
jgi:SAM-dependent methyltransferase